MSAVSQNTRSEDVTSHIRKDTIFVVEDDPDSARFAQFLLAEAGFDVMLAADGDSALQMISSGAHFDLMVLDIMLPGANGFQICARMKENPETRLIPVLVLTAKSSEEDRFNGLVLTDADAYMVKPADADELIETIEGLIRTSRVKQTEAARRVPEPLDF